MPPNYKNFLLPLFRHYLLIFLLWGIQQKNIYDNIGIQLRQIREEKKMTLIQLGKISGVSYTHISEIERGKTCASLKTFFINYC